MDQPHKSIAEEVEPLEPERFKKTRWSLIQQAGASDSGIAHDALSELCELYWYPVYAFVRRSGHGAAEAQDHTQAFFADLLQRRDFQKADRTRGKLRSFLIGATKHFLSKEREKERALKRGGGVAPLSIDQAQAEELYALEPVDSLSPEKLYERRWALTVLQRAMSALRESYERRDKQVEFETLLPFLSWNSGESYQLAATSLGITVGSAKVAVHRLRKRYREILIEQIAHTVTDESEIQEELSFLFTAFD